MASSNLLQWVSQSLQDLLGFDASIDFAAYILSMGSKTDLEEYLKEILDPTNKKHQHFINELLAKWRPSHSVVESVPEGAVVYRKSDLNETNKSQSDSFKQQVKPNSVRSTRPKGTFKPPAALVDAYPGDLKKTEKSGGSPDQSRQPDQKHSKKPNFVPVFSPEGQDRTVVMIPGRHSCVCQAHRHELINNCLNCGRVVCKQEGSGPCLFCGNLVCTEEEMEELAKGTKSSNKLREYLMSSKATSTLIKQEDQAATKAKEHKDKLLKYDRTSERRTKVIDDEADYYSTDSKWLSDKERKANQQKKDKIHAAMHPSRRDRKITFDFAGRKVIDASFEMPVELLDVDDNEVTDQMLNISKELMTGITNPEYLDKTQAPKFVMDNAAVLPAKPANNNKPNISLQQLRLQDKELQEVVDKGVCLSMHQPWASLLVAGIKMHEGRTWYSTHRGRLWIASTAKKPTDFEIKSVEDEYLGRDVSFPDKYPVSCLLGCVDVVDVLAQEEYREQYPDGESSSPFVFICENPQQLFLKFPIKGQHKIYKLEPQVHKSAKIGLQTNFTVK